MRTERDWLNNKEKTLKSQLVNGDERGTKQSKVSLVFGFNVKTKISNTFVCIGNCLVQVAAGGTAPTQRPFHG